MPKQTIAVCLGVFVFALLSFARPVDADEPLRLNPAQAPAQAPQTTERSAVPPAVVSPSFDISESQARSSIQWLAELAIRKAPRTFDGDKDWGKTKSVFNGVNLKRDGLRLKTSRRKKDVRHGRWIKYELSLPPAPKPGSKANNSGQANQIVTKIHQVTKSGDMKPGVSAAAQATAHWKIESSVQTPMKFTARIERWNRGIQWYSLSIEGRLKVRMDATSRLAFLADYSEVPPALVIAPEIETAKLHLEDFEVDRVSKIGGDVAEEWGELMEQVLVDIFIKKQNEKLTSKLNKAINKHRDDLRLSMADWFANW